MTTFADLARSKYVRLTTFRRDGTPVATPVWVIGDGDRVLVVTDTATGKVKRIRHTPRVLLAPCDGRGKVKDGVRDVEGRAELVDDPDELRRLLGMIIDKHPVLGRILGRKLRKKVGVSTVELRISPT